MQLPLDIKISDNASFDNFITSDHFLINSLRRLVTEKKPAVIYLWGSAGSGKSHLMQALCQQVGQSNQLLSYLPMKELIQYSVDILEGLESIPVICVDDVQLIAANSQWQQGLFHLFNQVAERGGRLLFAATASPRELGLALQDLVSRLEWGPVFHLQLLEDEQKIEALRLRARQRGLELDIESAKYVLSRFPRDLNGLFAVLDTLDAASMIKQRRISIPFIREVFSNTK